VTRLVPIAISLPADVWAAYQHAAKREHTSPEIIAREVLCEVCSEIVRAERREVAA